MIITILAIPITFSIVAMIINCQDYRHYKINYILLKNGVIKFNYEFKGVYFFRLIESDNIQLVSNKELIFFGPKEVKLLGRGVYLHNSIHNWIDPYAFYWRKKFEKWFNENKNNWVNPKEYQF